MENFLRRFDKPARIPIHRRYGGLYPEYEKIKAAKD
jgi:hypothetical protein